MMLDVMKLSFQTFARNIQRAGKFVSQVPHLRSIAQAIFYLTENARSAIAVPANVRSVFDGNSSNCRLFPRRGHLFCSAAGSKQDFLVQVRRWVSRNADVIDGFNPDAGGLQAVTNRFSRKAGAMFEAIEALFFSRSDQFAITDNRRRRITMIGVYSENDHVKNLELRISDCGLSLRLCFFAAFA